MVQLTNKPTEWATIIGNFLPSFSIKNMSSLFQYCFLEQLHLLNNEMLITYWIPNEQLEYDCVVVAKQSNDKVKQVTSNLVRYTHRITIANDRIIKVDYEKIVYSWNDYDKDYKKQIALRNDVGFKLLFCQHIFYPKFTRIRYYVFLLSAHKHQTLVIIRHDLIVALSLGVFSSLTWQEIAFSRLVMRLNICKYCSNKMVIIQSFANEFRNNRKRAPP